MYLVGLENVPIVVFLVFHFNVCFEFSASPSTQDKCSEHKQKRLEKRNKKVPPGAEAVQGQVRRGEDGQGVLAGSRPGWSCAQFDAEKRIKQYRET